jgi:predicted nucleotidyltransferase component of viral defense system
MAFREVYQRQAALLIRILPYVAEEECFALKGGSAINLFIRDMPRLSVDIDLTYLPVAPRSESLAAIHAAMLRIAARIGKALAGAQIARTELMPEKAVVKLLVRHQRVQVKIEVTPVLRGSVYKPELRSVSPAVEDAYGFAEIQVVSFADLYGGKLVAALDRQRPRDLFDARDLLAKEGIDDPLRRAFAVYLISHNRPMAEILDPARRAIGQEFLRGFDGMTATPVTIEDLEVAREEMIATLVGRMPDEHRRFLLSFERGEPAWELLGLPEARNLPAVGWRQQNLNLLAPGVRERLAAKLEQALAAAKTDRAPG